MRGKLDRLLHLLEYGGVVAAVVVVAWFAICVGLCMFISVVR